MFSSNVFDTRPGRQRIGVEHARATRLARDLPVDLVTEFKRIKVSLSGELAEQGAPLSALEKSFTLDFALIERESRTLHLSRVEVFV